MSSHRITVRVSNALGSRLRDRARAEGKTYSHLVRIALQSYLDRECNRRSAFELANEAGLIGCVRNAPRDLSTNRRHFRMIGKNE